MAKLKYNINKIEATTLESSQFLTTEDSNLVESFSVNALFNPSENFVEITFLSIDDLKLYSDSNYKNYTISLDGASAGKDGAVAIDIDPEKDLISYGYAGTDIKILYKFYNNLYSDLNQDNLFYIESISPDRTEVRLLSTKLTDDFILKTTGEVQSKILSSAYITEFYLYNRVDLASSAINIKTETVNGKVAIDVKLYEPLPNNTSLKDSVTLVENISDAIAFQVTTEIIPEVITPPTIKGPNFEIDVDEQTAESTGYFNYNELFSFPVNNSNRELTSAFAEKGATLSIDYTDYSEFINFSSAEERLRNFQYKVQLLESYQLNLDTVNTTSATAGISGSRDYYENLINGVLDNFDHYEKHLYYENGSTSWPKTNLVKPYVNASISNPVAELWFNTAVESATLYDDSNYDILTNTIPSYLREDLDNEPYLLLVHMVAQHFDNLWIYTKNVSEKYNADNRLNRGVSKDLVEDLLKNFGVKLYTSNKSVDDLFRYFTKNSYDTGNEVLSTINVSGEVSVSQNDYQKEIYKRLYHNLPLLLKSKGTERGLRALISCFGIPSDILKIKVYGGQSSNDLPFFGGDQAWTGSLDKVRTSNTGSIAVGDTLSYYTKIVQEGSGYTQDLHRIEVGFSPTDNIDSYIVSQSQVLFPTSSFNIDDYIGDPRETRTSGYFALNNYKDLVFENVSRYDVKDFVRLIKFFDNVIFRMVRDFIPARSVADTGIIIKPHLLERSKIVSPTMTYTLPVHTGSIDTAFTTGSNAGSFRSVGTGAVDGESSTNFRKGVQTPYGFVAAKQWVGDKGPGYFERSHNEAKFDGILSGSRIEVSTRDLNKNNPFKQINYPTVLYDVQFYRDVPANACSISVDIAPLYIDPLVSTSETNLFTLFGGISEIYDITVFFQGSTSVPVTAWNFTYDFTTQSTPGSWSQYDTYSVTATHSTLVGCNAVREVIVVACDLEIDSSAPFIVTSFNTYDISTWFNTSYNTNIEYLVNGIQIYDETTHTFTGYTVGESITVTVRDAIRNSCAQTRTVTFGECTLNWTSLTSMTYGSDGTGGYFLPPFAFTGTEASTSYEFRVRDNSLALPWSAWITPNSNPVYTEYLDLAAAYPDIGLITVGPYPVYVIQFRANSGGSCILESSEINLSIPTPVTLKVAVQNIGYNNDAFQPAQKACGFQYPVNIFAAYTEGSPYPTPSTVLANEYQIFAYNNTGLLAPAGYYSDGASWKYWNGTAWSGYEGTC